MLTVDKIRAGHGISWVEPGGYEVSGTVVKLDKDGVNVVRMYPLRPGDKCYNDVGIVHGDANYLVRMKDCPPPFSDVCADSPYGKCLAFADLKNPIRLPSKQFSVMQVKLSDGGKMVSRRDYQAIIDCAKHGTPEKQLSGPASPGTEKKPVPPDTGKSMQRKADPYIGGLQRLWENMQAEAESEDDGPDFDF